MKAGDPLCQCGRPRWWAVVSLRSLRSLRLTTAHHRDTRCQDNTCYVSEIRSQSLAILSEMESAVAVSMDGLESLALYVSTKSSCLATEFNWEREAAVCERLGWMKSASRPRRSESCRRPGAHRPDRRRGENGLSRNSSEGRRRSWTVALRARHLELSVPDGSPIRYHTAASSCRSSSASAFRSQPCHLGICVACPCT